MKKWKLFSAILLLLIICNVTSLHAADTSQTESSTDEEVVDDQKTPEATPRNNYIAPILFASTLLVVGYIYLQGYQNKRNKIYICAVKQNNDGSMTVTCGFQSKNHLKKNSKIDNKLEIQQGTAIILNENYKQKESLVAIINENTKLIWKFKDQSLEIDGNKLKNKEKEDLWEKH